MLKKLTDVFKMPDGLPNPREVEHQIVLKEGTNPISVKPYRYPQVQKAKIERLVGGMLKEGIIKPSTSPFSIGQSSFERSIVEILYD